MEGSIPSLVLIQYIDKSLRIEAEEAHYPRSPKSSEHSSGALSRPLGSKDKISRNEAETCKQRRREISRYSTHHLRIQYTTPTQLVALMAE